MRLLRTILAFNTILVELTGALDLVQQYALDELSDSDQRPNIVFILTDDQDYHLDSLEYMPFVKRHLLNHGLEFKRHFCTTAICCPARVSLLTGRLAHNTNVTDINPPYGGFPKFVSEGFNENYLPIWLQEAGYNTYYTGKLFNAHTVDNYDSPHAAGWTQSEFLLDPFTYSYLNATFQRGKSAPVSHEGQYSGDVLASKAYGLLSDAVEAGKPFFLGIAPIAPHSDVYFPNGKLPKDQKSVGTVKISPPVPAKRHETLFSNAKVRRTPHFNPETPSGASWIRERPLLSDANIDFNDHYYRQRLRTLQSVDEMVDGIVKRLEDYKLLSSTYIIYTTDNGFHISQHRLQPGKQCGFEEDINVPLIIRGPGIPENQSTAIVTNHVDIAPTILKLARAPSRQGFDGEAIPLTSLELTTAKITRQEHVTVEFWGFAAFEGGNFDDSQIVLNNTYKAIRIVSESFNVYYSVWCTNEHELYDLKTDPYQLHNLLSNDEEVPALLFGIPSRKVLDRLDALLFVLKSCKGEACVRPWQALHPQGNVHNLDDALSPHFDKFYSQQARVRYDHCDMKYVPEIEGPQFERDGMIYQQASMWPDLV